MTAKFSLPSARKNLRDAIQRVEPPALDYIDWDTFEAELDKAVSVTDVSKDKVLQVFAKAVTRARQRYHRAVQNGAHWKQ